jgi:hypothetical protein
MMINNREKIPAAYKAIAPHQSSMQTRDALVCPADMELSALLSPA